MRRPGDRAYFHITQGAHQCSLRACVQLPAAGSNSARCARLAPRQSALRAASSLAASLLSTMWMCSAPFVASRPSPSNKMRRGCLLASPLIPAVIPIHFQLPRWRCRARDLATRRAAGMSAPSASEVSKRVTSFESYRASTRKRTATHMRSSPRTYQGFSFMAFSTARVGSIAYRVADQIWNVP